MAAPVGELPQLGLLCTFGVGAFVMRGAGCTINDLWDREIDAKVERTKSRPLASGVRPSPFVHIRLKSTFARLRFVQALSVAQAVGFLGVQLSVGLAVLLSLNKSVPHSSSRCI
jgi:4-hydroxybenzoate polyprenyltransferase